MKTAEFLHLNHCLMTQLTRCLPLILLSAGSLPAAEPEVASIEYDKPAKYLEFPDSLGDRAEISAQAARLKAGSDSATILRVLNWMDTELKYDRDKAYSWRNYDDAVREKVYGGCADQAIVCGVLLKAVGIPVVWVKTMDVSWIWNFKKGRSFQSWSGHVFLEVHVDKKWALLDPGAKTIYPDYSVHTRILPGNRFAYHKGNDPKAMVMSLQWEEWKEQTTTYFRNLDESVLPVDSEGGTPLAPAAFVIGNSPYYQTLTRMAVETGFSVPLSFNCDFDKNLPRARGHVLLVETHRGVPIAPVEVLEEHFPGCSKGLRQPDGTIEVAGTRIVFVEFSRQLEKLKAPN
jgi:hypothetical protein